MFMFQSTTSVSSCSLIEIGLEGNAEASFKKNSQNDPSTLSVALKMCLPPKAHRADIEKCLLRLHKCQEL